MPSPSPPPATKRKHPTSEIHQTRKHRREGGGGGIRWKEKNPKPVDADTTSAPNPRPPPPVRNERETRPSPPPLQPKPRREEQDVDAEPDDKSPRGQADGVDQEDSLDILSKFGTSGLSTLSQPPSNLAQQQPANSASKPGKPHRKKDKEKENHSQPKPSQGPQINEPMLEVIVNDRLGSKSRIACLGSDKVGDFKKLVAMQIGRKPHEIMLKRQSERPFKDFLTLDDYGVSSGVQLDLELDTGD